jgi:DNA-directed RNA polymerase subunit K/omega
MIRDKVDSTPVIDLTGPQGNAYALMGMASRYARQLGLDSDAVLAEMQEGNYENLVQIFDRYFGEYVILER